MQPAHWRTCQQGRTVATHALHHTARTTPHALHRTHYTARTVTTHVLHRTHCTVTYVPPPRTRGCMEPDMGTVSPLVEQVLRRSVDASGNGKVVVGRQACHRPVLPARPALPTCHAGDSAGDGGLRDADKRR